MNKPSLYPTFFLCVFLSLFLFSCEKSGIRNLSFDGDLYAKNLISLQYNLPDNSGEIEFIWYMASSPDGEWEKLPGIWTDEIILLTDYVDKYIKCEISYSSGNGDERITASLISSNPVEYNGNPNTDWFRDAGFGIMVHYLFPVFISDGPEDWHDYNKYSQRWNDVVNSFDVEKFAHQANEAGAGYVMYTLGQNSGYYSAPNSVFDSIVGVKPGDLCSYRDLPMDLIEALGRYDIPLILYLPSNPPVRNKLVSEKFKYPYGKDSATTQYNQAILENMIREWSLRYGDGAKGWWFDGLYSWNDIRSTRMDMSLKHNISTHALAAKAGNKQSIVTFNSGFGPIQVNTPYCDYSSGEKSTIDEFPSGRWVGDGVQWFLFTYLGEKWGGKGQQFETDVLAEMAEKIVENEGVLCLEVVTDETGEILPHHFEQIQAVGRRLGRVDSE